MTEWTLTDNIRWQPDVLVVIKNRIDIVRRHVRSTCLIAALSVLPAVASESIAASRDAIVAFYSERGSAPEIDERGRTIEICPDNLCDHYQLRDFRNARAWDVVFLHQYYYAARLPYLEQFRDQYAELATNLMARYRGLCPRAAEPSKPGCVIGYLGLKTGVKYAFVRYDEGERCEVWTHLVHFKTMYRSRCTKVKDAS